MGIDVQAAYELRSIRSLGKPLSRNRMTMGLVTDDVTNESEKQAEHDREECSSEDGRLARRSHLKREGIAVDFFTARVQEWRWVGPIRKVNRMGCAPGPLGGWRTAGVLAIISGTATKGAMRVARSSRAARPCRAPLTSDLQSKNEGEECK